MFDVKFIQKTLKELKTSLNNEFKGVEKTLSKKQISTFKRYRDENSLAGMSVWLESFAEKEYFTAVLEELQDAEKKRDVTVKTFQEIITKVLLEDFREEDFRLLEWERAEPSYPILSNILTTWIQTAKKKLEHFDKTYSLKNTSFNIYWGAEESPAKVGANVKLIPKKTPKEKILQIQNAEEEIKNFFPEGYERYRLLTQKIIIVQSENLVSYSFFSEPGISYINVIDRNLLETMDDLIHENAHHHLNLILKKYNILKIESVEKFFYSPWRREYRDLYAILHSVFTFSFAAKLFFAIFTQWGKFKTKLTEKDFETACVRFIEETLMLEYSLYDMSRNLDSFTHQGKLLIQKLISWNEEHKRYVSMVKSKIKEKKLLSQISELKETLKRQSVK